MINKQHSVRPDTPIGEWKKLLSFLSLSLGLGLSLGFGSTGSLPLLGVLGDELLVLGGLLLGCLEALKLLSLDELLAAEAFLSDEALDLGGLPVSLVTTLDLALGNVLANVVLLWVESEDGSNLVLSLLEETVRHLLVGAALNFLVALLHDLEGHDSEVWAGEAATDRLSSSVTSSPWVEERALYRQQKQIKIKYYLI